MRCGLIGTLVIAASLSACDTMIENSKFNSANEQIGRVENLDVVNEKEFKFDMTKFVAGQLFAIQTKLDEKKVRATGNVPGLCQANIILATLKAPDSANTLTSKLNATIGTKLATDRVMQVSIVTGFMGSGSQSEMDALDTVVPGGTALGFADFQVFLRQITDAAEAGEQGISLPGALSEESKTTLLQAILFDRATFSENAGPAIEASSNSPLLAYLGAYYQGKFVDRFGKSIEKPSFKNGVEDGTISNFVRILLETGIDSITPYEPVLKDDSGKFYPGDKQPTFDKVFGKLPGASEKIVSDGGQGVTEAESKLIEFGSNLIAEQAVTAASALLEFLASVDIGFVVAPNFAIGGNDTLKSLARGVIETSVRRGAERGLFCLVKKYNLNDVALVLKD